MTSAGTDRLFQAVVEHCPHLTRLTITGEAVPRRAASSALPPAGLRYHPATHAGDTYEA